MQKIELKSTKLLILVIVFAEKQYWKLHGVFSLAGREECEPFITQASEKKIHAEDSKVPYLARTQLPPRGFLPGMHTLPA